MTRASFQMSGKVPFSRDALNTIAKGCQMALIASLKSFVGILSGLGDFETFKAITPFLI